jgi:hypothetical protein
VPSLDLLLGSDGYPDESSMLVIGHFLLAARELDLVSLGKIAVPAKEVSKGMSTPEVFPIGLSEPKPRRIHLPDAVRAT